MEAVKEHGTALVEDPGRVAVVTNLGVDETSYLKATATHPTLYLAMGEACSVKHGVSTNTKAQSPQRLYPPIPRYGRGPPQPVDCTKTDSLPRIPASGIVIDDEPATRQPAQN
ncbi:MAG TPA: hypothetical protein VK988_21395 [Acidimicrobiales bacterium]|nr:hypothetical protein [Acidimicrobiales bacterium]